MRVEFREGGGWEVLIIDDTVVDEGPSIHRATLFNLLREVGIEVTVLSGEFDETGKWVPPK